jgi:hypothetical protein
MPQLVKDTYNIEVVGEVVFDRSILLRLVDHVAEKKGLAAFRRIVESSNKSHYFKVRDKLKCLF